MRPGHWSCRQPKDDGKIHMNQGRPCQNQFRNPEVEVDLVAGRSGVQVLHLVTNPSGLQESQGQGQRDPDDDVDVVLSKQS